MEPSLSVAAGWCRCGRPQLSICWWEFRQDGDEATQGRDSHGRVMGRAAIWGGRGPAVSAGGDGHRSTESTFQMFPRPAWGRAATRTVFVTCPLAQRSPLYPSLLQTPVHQPLQTTFPRLPCPPQAGIGGVRGEASVFLPLPFSVSSASSLCRLHSPHLLSRSLQLCLQGGWGLPAVVNVCVFSPFLFSALAAPLSSLYSIPSAEVPDAVSVFLTRL